MGHLTSKIFLQKNRAHIKEKGTEWFRSAVKRNLQIQGIRGKSRGSLDHDWIRGIAAGIKLWVKPNIDLQDPDDYDYYYYTTSEIYDEEPDTTKTEMKQEIIVNLVTATVLRQLFYDFSRVIHHFFLI